MFSQNDIINRRGFYSVALLCILLFLFLCSLEPVRMVILQYHLNKRDYISAEEICIKIRRKRMLSGKFDREFQKRILEQWKISMADIMEKEISVIQKEYNSPDLHIDKVAFGFERIQTLIEPSLLEELNIWKQCKLNSWRQSNKLVRHVLPYSIETGYLENDVNPGSGQVNLGCGGVLGLDYNLRSIGTNLGNKKPVVAIRIRWQAEKTRVKPENLSLWISNDNKHYLKYIGKITFTDEKQAMLLDNISFTCQYLKIHCDFRDDKSTFVEDIKRIIEVYGPRDFN